MKTFAFPPAFSTTAEGYRFAAAAILNSAAQFHELKKRYHPLPEIRLTNENEIGPGFPSVTLLGEREDWKRLATLTHNILTELGSETKAWAQMLKPILSWTEQSFDAPDEPGTKDFWRLAARFSGGGTGVSRGAEYPGNIYLSVSRIEKYYPRFS